jgi:kynurenine formamidase
MVGFVSDNDLNEDSVRALLEKDILPVGALDLPEKLPKSFLFIATPLKIRGRNGSPIRAVTIVQENRTI